MSGTGARLVRAAIACAALGGVAGALAAGAENAPPPAPLVFDRSLSVHERRIHPAPPPENVDWKARVDALLREQPGDVVLTAVGDMIFNEQISTLREPHHRQLFRILQEADLAYGNLEFSLNRRPELQRPFYNFRTDPEFAFELAAIGINLVSMANNHALDFGPEGLSECLAALDRASIDHAGAGTTLAAARAPATTKVQSLKTKFALLSTMRYWTRKYRCADSSGPCLSTIDPAEILVAGPGGTTETVEGPLLEDVERMEDDIVLAARHNDFVMFSLHIHDKSHHRAFGIQDTTPPNDALVYRRAIDAGAQLVLGSGPHVLRGIELYKGRPIFHSLSNFIYQYRTPSRIPVDLIHQRDGEIARPDGVSVFDLRDPREVMETIVARITINDGRIRRIELIPVTIDDEGPLYGTPRLASDARGREILARAHVILETFGENASHVAFLVDGFVAGPTAVATVRRNFPNQFLHYHRAGHGMITSRQSKRGYTAFVLAKLARMMGASGLHTGGMGFGKMEGGPEDRAIADVLDRQVVQGPAFRQDWGGMKAATPIVSGGMNALRLPGFFANLKHANVILTAGGGAFGHLDGPAAGARSLRAAVQAWREGADLTAFARDHAELARAFFSFPHDADALYPGWREVLAG